MISDIFAAGVASLVLAFIVYWVLWDIFKSKPEAPKAAPEPVSVQEAP